MEAGRGTVADLAEAYERRLEAELDLLVNQKQAGDIAALIRRVNDLERKVDQLQKGSCGEVNPCRRCPSLLGPLIDQPVEVGRLMVNHPRINRSTVLRRHGTADSL